MNTTTSPALLLWLAALVTAHVDGAHQSGGLVDPSGYWVETGCPRCCEEVAARDAYLAKIEVDAARARARRVKRDERKAHRDPYTLSAYSVCGVA